ncbi:MAG: hypothetical protein ABL986_14760 [Vicinamibacterales bacterium]
MDPAAQWSPATRVAFRFFFVYLTLWSLATQVVGGLFQFPGYFVPSLGPLWPMADITYWVSRTFFGVEAAFERGNSADTLFWWVQTAWLLVLSMFVTVVWSWVGRRRVEYATVHKWFFLFIRFALAAQMFYYGMAKVIPIQFMPPALTTLVQPIGAMPLSTLLWVFIGSSPLYQLFSGVAEVVAAVLLVIPRTTPLGALIAMMDMIQVFALNMSYDFGLKQISFHYIVMALFLLAPDWRRLLNVLVLDRSAPAPTRVPLFRSADANRVALIVQLLAGAYLLGNYTFLEARQYDAPEGPAHPKSALYGIWDIERMSIDGEFREPVFNDYDLRWRRAIFDFPNRMAFQRTDDSLTRYDVLIDTDRGTITFSKFNSQTWRATFTFQRPAADQLVLEGTFDGHAVRLDMEQVGLDTFPLLNSPFRWIRPPE